MYQLWSRLFGEPQGEWKRSNRRLLCVSESIRNGCEPQTCYDDKVCIVALAVVSLNTTDPPLWGFSSVKKALELSLRVSKAELDARLLTEVAGIGAGLYS